MLKSTITTFKPTLQCRYASVLSSSSFSPSVNCTGCPSPSPLQHDSSYIVTPASAPFTTPSNNAFHPAHIPKKTQVRLTLDELKEVLDSSKQLLQHLQQEYIDKSASPSSLQTPMELQHIIEKLTDDQIRLIESLSSPHNGKKRSPRNYINKGDRNGNE
ncbi:hypothetical protein BCR42DRAFT_448293 [Absidia repens]|uniref:Uncharacterized protein n=1 Tax=Absidia repens TaxID=90262 RepID=A0A1X2IU19_9FUNG|nr:hypothetical protein BCR42DRAFT_448293 [Absidia repens]